MQLCDVGLLAAQRDFAAFHLFTPLAQISTSLIMEYTLDVNADK